MSKKAVLLIQLGTPLNCDANSVRHYLREFLNDRRVIDLPALIRWPLVNLFIIPARYKKTTLAYQKIWREQGSPLLIFSEQMKLHLAQELGADYHVELGMRYGEPTIQNAFHTLKQYDSLTVIPLFPQYSSAATGSALESLVVPLMRQWNIPQLSVRRDFFKHPGYVAAFAAIIREHIQQKPVDLLIFSYHGLPERHLHKSECLANCDRKEACPSIADKNRFCYRAQCYATSHLLAAELGLSANQFTVSFQSRLGRTPWIKPYTDVLLPTLIQKGIKNIAIVSPSFVVDCLETLEEVDIRTRAQWQALGGEHFTFIPCIQSSPLWIKALADMVRNP